MGEEDDGAAAKYMDQARRESASSDDLPPARGRQRLEGKLQHLREASVKTDSRAAKRVSAFGSPGEGALLYRVALDPDQFFSCFRICFK